MTADYGARHCCPSHCVDDLCVASDVGLCGHWRCDYDQWGEEYEDDLDDVPPNDGSRS